MKWHDVNEHPKAYECLVLLFDGHIEFDGDFDGENFRTWNNDNQMWSKRSIGLVGWMYQSEVEDYLIGLKD